jgi:hypothetical protein
MSPLQPTTIYQMLGFYVNGTLLSYVASMSTGHFSRQRLCLCLLQVMLDGHDPALKERVLLSAEVPKQILKEHKGWTIKWDSAPQVAPNPALAPC